jgi:outer membrane protein assembly factor BamB/ankyrin repeat protein
VDSYLKEVTQILYESFIIKNVLLIILLILFSSSLFGQSQDPFKVIWQFDMAIVSHKYNKSLDVHYVTDDNNLYAVEGKKGDLISTYHFDKTGKYYIYHFDNVGNVYLTNDNIYLSINGIKGTKNWQSKFDGDLVLDGDLVDSYSTSIEDNDNLLLDIYNFQLNQSALLGINAMTGKIVWRIDYSDLGFEDWQEPMLVNKYFWIMRDNFFENDPHLIVFNLDDGTKRWEYKGHEEIVDIFGDKIFVTKDNNKLVVLDASDGNELWEFNASGTVSPWGEDKLEVSLNKDDTVFVAHKNSVHALNLQTGNIKWAYTNDSMRLNHYKPVIGLNGLIYIIGGKTASNILALDAHTGDSKWIYKTDNSLREFGSLDNTNWSPIFIYPNGNLIFADWGEYNDALQEPWVKYPTLHCIEPNSGNLIWKFSKEMHFPNLPSLDGELGGDLTMNCETILPFEEWNGLGILIKLNAANGKIIWEIDHEIGMKYFGRRTQANGTLYGVTHSKLTNYFDKTSERNLTPLPNNDFADLVIRPRWLILEAADSFDSVTEMVFTSYDGKTTAPKIDTFFGHSYISRELKLLNKPTNTWATDYIVGEEYGSLTFYDPILDANENGHPDLAEFGLPINRTFDAEFIQNFPKSGVKTKAVIHFYRPAYAQRGFYTISMKTPIGTIELDGTFWVSVFSAELAYNTENKVLEFSISDTDASGDDRTISALAGYSQKKDGSLELKPFSAIQTVNGEKVDPIKYNKSVLKWFPNLNIFKGHVTVKDGDTLSSWPDMLDYTFVLYGTKPKKTLIQASWDNDLKSLEQHISIATDLDTTDSDGWTPLYISANRGYINLTQTLIDAKANIESTTNKGLRPLHTASFNGHFEIVKLLLNKGAYIEAEIEDEGKWRALHLASRYGHTDIVKILLENNANIEARNNSGWRALHLASRYGHTDIVKILLENNANVEARQNAGMTPLYLAAAGGHTDILDFLIFNDANIQSISNYSRSALHTAAYYGHAEAAILLIREGIDFTKKDDSGLTALDLAIQKEHQNVIDVIKEETKPRPPVITVQPFSQTVPMGVSVTFHVEAKSSGTEPLSYRWRRNGVFLGPVTENSTLTLKNVQPEQAGTYRVVVNDTAGQVMSEAAKLVVIEVFHTLTVATLNPQAGVTIDINPEDKNGQLGGTTQFIREYLKGNKVTLTAEQIIGDNMFKQWLKNGVSISTEPTVTVTIDQDFTLRAVYEPRTLHTLTVATLNPEAGVTIDINPEDMNGHNDGTTQFTRSYLKGTKVTLTADPTSGTNQFKHWLKNGVPIGTWPAVTVTIDQDFTLRAVYEPRTFHTLTVATLNPQAGVTIDINPEDKNGQLGGTTQFIREYLKGNKVTLAAEQIIGDNMFKQWLKNGVPIGTEPTVTVTIDQDFTLRAVYEPRTFHTLTVATLSGLHMNPDSGVTVTISPEDKNGQLSGTTQFMREYLKGTKVTLTAGQSVGDNQFKQWLKNGVPIGTEPTVTVTIDQDFTLRAVYEPRTFHTLHTLRVATLYSDSGVMVTVSPEDRHGQSDGTTQFKRVYPKGTKVTLTVARTNGGTYFNRWLKNGVPIGTEPTVTITIDQDFTLRAAYEQTVMWKFQPEDSVYSSPAIGSDGTVYVGSNASKLYALDGKTGKINWQFKTDKTEGTVITGSSPAIGTDGTVYTGSVNGRIHAINPNGTKKWQIKLGGSAMSSPSIGKDGTVYVGSFDSKFYALDGKTGKVNWFYKTGAAVESTPAISADGTIYFGSYDHKIYALDGKRGTKKWEFDTGVFVSSSPAIGSDGTVYIGTHHYRGRLYALNGKTGSKIWEFKAGIGSMRSSPAIGSDGTLYVGSDDHKVYAVNPDGTNKWVLNTQGGRRWSSPSIGSDGTIYIAAGNQLYTINPQGSNKRDFITGNASQFFSPAIGSDGSVYVVGGGCLYALGSSSSGPADSPWPMFGQNAQRTGRVLTPEKNEPIELNILRTTIYPFTFIFTAKENLTYEVQVTQDLQDWSKLGEVKGTSGEVEFTDPRQPIVPFKRNYYRVKLVE